MFLRNPFWRKLVWSVVDFFVLMAVVYVVTQFRLGTEISWQLFDRLGYWFVVFSGIILAYIFGFYEFRDFLNRSSTLIRSGLFLLSFLGAVILANYIFAKERGGLFGRGVLISSAIIYSFYLASVRSVLAYLYERVSESTRFYFLTSQARGSEIRSWTEKYNLMGKKEFIGVAQLVNLNLGTQDILIVDLTNESEKTNAYSLLFDLKTRGTKVYSVADFSEIFFFRIPVDFLRIQWFIFESGFALVANGALIRLKRLGDLILAGLGLLLASPFMALVSLGILIESGKPVFYSQIRTGKDRRPFKILKFRSMVTNAEVGGAQWAQKNDARVTRFGKFIRATRLDELPQLFNIIKGDMSFVGPRPERPEFDQLLEQQIDFYSARYLVRPGLTGWAQVNYPYGSSVEDAKEKLQLDLYYIKNYNPLLDLRIILKTVRVVLERMGR